jgi:glycosyltransferase involved in cell wall biosynthesis
MRIGFFGNTNNYPFLLASALRRRGHDLVFFIDQTDPLYRPESRLTHDNPNEHDWTIDVSPARFRDYVLPNAKMARVVRLLRTCDAVVLNQYGPALLPKVRRPALLLLTGSDLDFFANPASIEVLRKRIKDARTSVLRRKLELWGFRMLIRAQREGIRLAGAVSYFPRGSIPIGDRLLDELGIGDDRRLYLSMTDARAVSRADPPFNDPPRIACIARLNWKMPMRLGATALDYKGIDEMLRGLARFIDRGGRIEIHLVRKGWDVAETKDLAAQLGIEHCVVWHDEMPQADFLDFVRQSDLVIDQLAGSLPGMGALDSLALGRPVIANWRHDLVPQYRLPGPANCQASSAEEVCAQLERLLGNKAELARASEASRQFAEERLSSDAAAATCESLLKSLISCPDTQGPKA